MRASHGSFTIEKGFRRVICRTNEYCITEPAHRGGIFRRPAWECQALVWAHPGLYASLVAGSSEGLRLPTDRLVETEFWTSRPPEQMGRTQYRDFGAAWGS